MPDQEDLIRLMSGHIDLSRTDLREADLSNQDLQGRDFTGARLDRVTAVNTNFRGCKFSEAKLTGLRASGADFREVVLRLSLVAVDFTGARLDGAIFDNAGHNRVNFTRADIRGAKFRRTRFGDDVVFADAIFDDLTDFEGAQGLRYLSRMPVFQNYNYDRGVFTRKPEIPIKSSGESADVFRAEVRVETPLSGNRVQISRTQAEIGAMAANLAVAIDQHLQLIEASKPNEPEALAQYNGQIDLLKTIAAGLREIAAALDARSDANDTDEGRSRASRMVEELSQKLEAWLAANGTTLVGNTINVGMIGMSSAFFALCGAPALFAFATATAVVGGKPVVEGVKELLKGMK